LTYVTTL